MMPKCFAVCTIGSDFVLDNSNVAICMPCKTENLGIEKMVKTIISMPEIRFLLLCGDEITKRNVGECIIHLIKDGIEENGKIKNASGLMPYLKELTTEEVEYFRKQIILINIIGEKNIKKLDDLIDENAKSNPGIFKKEKPKSKQIPIIEAKADYQKEWTADEKPDQNWFLVGYENNKVYVEHFVGYGQDTKKCCKIIGETPEDVLWEIVKRMKVKGLYHASYLGKELEKAYISMKLNKKYVQENQMEF